MIKVETQLKLEQQAGRRVNAAMMLGVRDLFENELLPAAREMSPYGTGENRDSLSYKVRRSGETIKGTFYSQSGHGGFLEKGTSKMSARPYIFPAWSQASANLGALLSARLAQFAEIDATVEEFGVEGLAVALKTGKFAKPKRKPRAK